MTSVKLINHSSSTADWNNYLKKNLRIIHHYILGNKGREIAR